MGTGGAENQEAQANCRSPHKLIPPFNDKRDDLDAFLQRFERVASSQNWPPAKWALSLSLCLTGEALTVVGRMTPEESLDYAKVKLSLLQRFRYTTEGYREKFRDGKPEDAETGRQFAARLLGYFDRWIETGETPKTYEGLRDLIVSEQFLKRCNTKLSIFLKERNCRSLENLATTADHFLEAQGQTSLFKLRDDSDHKSGGCGKEGNKTQHSIRVASRCYLCNKPGHRAADCWTSSKAPRPSACWRCGKAGHKAEACNWKSDREKDKASQASCVLTTADETESEKAYVLLKNGDKIPVVNMAVGKPPRFLVDDMPVVRGEVGGRTVTALRDSGCNTVVVKRSLVPDNKLTGFSSPVFLLDRTIKYLPEAEIEVKTPYFTGSLVAKCMDNPLYDLVLGNIKGVRRIDDPDEEWDCDRGQIVSKAREAEIETDQTAVGGETAKELAMSEKREEKDCKVLEKVSDCAGALGKAPGKKNISELPVMSVEPTEVDKRKLRMAQENDETLNKCFASIGRKFGSEKAHESEFVLHDGILYRRYRTPSRKEWEQLVVPRDFRMIVLKLAHEGIMAGHQGTKKTTDRVQEEFYWPGVTAEIKRFVKSCDICQRTVPKHLVARAPLGTMEIIGTPFQRVGIDIIGPIKPSSENGNRYILTMIDFATRYPDAVALKSMETTEVAEGLLQKFSRVGLPQEVLSDRGSCSTSGLMKEISRLLSLRQLTTTPYHPMGNGLVERLNGTLKQMIRRMCQEKPRCWDRYLTLLLFAYREVPHSSLGFSPFDLLYGRYIRGPMAVLKELWTNENIDPETKTTYGYMVDLWKRLEDTCKVAHEELRKAQKTQKGYYDKKSRVRELQEGDPVLILLPTDKNKLILQWKGPFRVVERRNELDYVIDLGGKTTLFHVNMLKKYEEREVLGAPEQVLAGLAVEEEGEEQEVPHVGLRRQQDHNDVRKSEELSEEQVTEVEELLESFQEVFSDLPGRTNLVKCQLKLTTDVPVQVRQYPLAFALQEAVEKEIGDMLSLGIIEKCDSPYNSPVVVGGECDDMG
ncbi:uncharacterized protein LOC120849798 [Ixodes scapularis]|uniref:uncharacterized protein LOC120849798 n=1 Tax=Ixodes scapularis TaxID=6945 RepID=UPI001C3889A4|nr:uncharacterized protein LOC120849798 [Ixodes scapularis]